MYESVLSYMFKMYYMWHSKLLLPEEAIETAKECNFELKGYGFEAAPEQLRLPRKIRVGLIQNHIVLPTYAPILDQVRILVIK